MSNTVSRESTPSDFAILEGSRKRSLSCSSDDGYNAENDNNSCDKQAQKLKSHGYDNEYNEELNKANFDDLAPKRKSPEELLWCPFTDNFFDDMATMIARDFPVTQFAKRHNCEGRDVLHALHAVVMDPLRRTQTWHEGLSVSEYAQMLIANWRAPYIPSPSGLLGAGGSQSSPIFIADDSPGPLSPRENSEISGVGPYKIGLDGFEESPKKQLGAILRAYANGSPGCKKRRYGSRTPSVDGSSRSAPAALGIFPPSNSPNQNHDRIQLQDQDPAPGDSSGESTILDTSPTKTQRATSEQEKGPVARTECRKSADGTWIPTHKWIPGYHRPAVRGDDDHFE
ncbi:hypothetical protein N7533_010141 [Penicillium manginii]|jgi:hypothetical protein|uniref:uncharacterized protein n=1 Tax=Penicillium manginii TaxID=203109 RepID=UPI002546DE1E|nr:uncharacterized protein N7533_010141 [Penicillium manginii]KAJ5743039.1 hypothetical protein N7533_010141 [Penicillium manginii]